MIENYEIEHLEDGVTRIQEKSISPEWRCNIWHIRGRDRDLIIDTGFGLTSISATIASLTERPIIAVCTHSHHDHAGGLHQFETRCGHPAEADIFANPTRQSTVSDLLDATVIRKAPYADFDIDRWCYQAAPLTSELDEGDVVDLGDRHFNIIHVPGHSPGSIALLEKKTGILFSGDALYNGVLYDHLYHSVPEQLRDSLERLCALPVSTFHAGHFDSFDMATAKIIVGEYLRGQRSMLCPAE